MVGLDDVNGLAGLQPKRCQDEDLVLRRSGAHDPYSVSDRVQEGHRRTAAQSGGPVILFPCPCSFMSYFFALEASKEIYIYIYPYCIDLHSTRASEVCWEFDLQAVAGGRTVMSVMTGIGDVSIEACAKMEGRAFEDLKKDERHQTLTN